MLRWEDGASAPAGPAAADVELSADCSAWITFPLISKSVANIPDDSFGWGQTPILDMTSAVRVANEFVAFTSCAGAANSLSGPLWCHMYIYLYMYSLSCFEVASTRMRIHTRLHLQAEALQLCRLWMLQRPTACSCKRRPPNKIGLGAAILFQTQWRLQLPKHAAWLRAWPRIWLSPAWQVSCSAVTQKSRSTDVVQARRLPTCFMHASACCASARSCLHPVQRYKATTAATAS